MAPSDPIHKLDPRNIDTLLEVMSRLRDPKTGCPWDLEQDYASIAPYTIEEAYEVEDAIARGDINDLRDELGDLLFQTVFQGQIAKEKNDFDFGDIVAAITQKMIRRHPHIFATGDERSADEQTQAWEAMKAKERAAKGSTGLLDDVPVGLPGLTRAVKLQKRAAQIGFDWPNAHQVLDKIAEETGELVDAMASKDSDSIEDEFGDLLFVMANLSRHLKVDPEKALRRANDKFKRRFAHVEEKYNQSEGVRPTLDQMEEWWQEAKKLERD